MTDAAALRLVLAGVFVWGAYYSRHHASLCLFCCFGAALMLFAR